MMGLGLCVLALAAAADDGWHEFVPSEGGYTVLLPGTPKEKIMKADSSRGQIDVPVVMAEHKGVVYTVLHQEDADIPPARRDRYLDGLVDGHVRSRRGRLTASAKITWEERPGRDATIETPRAGDKAASVTRLRLILVGSRCYELMVVSAKDRATAIDPEVQRFFGSFHERPPDPPGTWRTFRSNAGRFAVSLPGVPEEKHQADRFEPEAPEVVTFTTNSKDGSFLVSYHDVTATQARRPAALLDATCEVAIQNSRGKRLSVRKITVGRHPGREFTAEVPIGNERGAGRLRGRVLLVGRRVYHVLAIAPKDDIDAEAIDKYFESFKVEVSGRP
jgi:hypothetical protein